MQSLDALNLLPVWVNPDHLASTAKILLAGHRLKVLGVVEGSELVGVVTLAKAEEEPDGAKVREFMRAPGRVVDAATPLRQLAETFWQEDLDYIPVVQNGRFRGIVTPNMLLKEMARSWDPLTGLSWSDRLREWGVENLKEGREITIVFIDLDDFGSYNKRYGHIVGDRVLQAVAEMIQDRIEPSQDQLVRYGGDEFAIGTIRDQPASMELARSLEEGMTRLRVAGSDEPVTFSVGVQGGKRTKERENVHYAATLDNLINLASKQSMAKKLAKKTDTSQPAAPPEYKSIFDMEVVTSETAADLAEAQEPEVSTIQEELTGSMQGIDAPASAVIEQPEPAPVEPEKPRQFRIAEVFADPADANSVTQVSLEADGVRVTGICPRKGGSVVKSVAVATANAICLLRPDLQLDMRDVVMSESEAGVRFISVIGIGKVNGHEQPVGGIGTVTHNLYFSTAEATLQAFSNLVAGQPQHS